MAPKTKPGFYAVRVGRVPGVYASWPEAQAQVNGWQGAIHKKLPTRGEAQAFVDGAPNSGMTRALPVASTSGAGRVDGLGRNVRAMPDGEGGEPDRKRARVEGPQASGSFEPVSRSGNGKRNSRRVFCDGSCLGNGKKNSVAGVGIFWGHELGDLNLSERLPGTIQTNNRAEMYAVARILETDPTPDLPLTICTDSQYTISVFSTWIPGWRSRGWRTSTGGPVLNKDLILYILALISLRMPPNSFSPTANVSFEKVKAHVGIEGNEEADRFAKIGAGMGALPERDYVEERRKIEVKLKEKGTAEKENEITFEVLCEEGDLLSVEELRRMEEEQDF